MSLTSHQFLYNKLKSEDIKPQMFQYVKRCNVCGKRQFQCVTYDMRSALCRNVREKGVCFECAFWMNFIESERKYAQVTNGVCYNILPFVGSHTIYEMLGSNGKRQFFITKDMKRIMSNDVWLIGKVPDRFRGALPDTGWFCAESIYKKVGTLDRRCNAVGCLDRYKCFRFKYELELENGPFNKVPAKWKTGGERCRYLLNTDLIYNYTTPLAT